jgi:5'-nucleotidase
MIKERKVIAVDMDNTICDFITPYNKALKAEPGIIYPQSQYGFFAKLVPIPGATRALRQLMVNGFEVHIVTRPSIYNPLCYTEKRVWVEEYLGLHMCEYFTITTHKHRFIADYLIDDTLWPGFIGEQILYGQEPFDDWSKVIRYIFDKEGLIN